MENSAALRGGARRSPNQQGGPLAAKLLDLPGYVFRVFVTNRHDSPLEIWRDYNGRATVELRGFIPRAKWSALDNYPAIG